MSNKKNILFLLLLLIPLLFFVAPKLNKISLWHDEAFSALLIKYSFNEMIYRIGLDVHPPLYYIVLRGWTFLFKDSLFSLRFLNVLIGIITTLFLYLLVEKCSKNKKLAFFSSLLFTYSSFQIQYFFQARMYTLGVFFIVASSYFLIRALETKKWSFWILYGFFASCGIYTHYYLIFSILSQAVFLFLHFLQKFKFKAKKWLKEKNVRMTLLIYFFIFLSYLPWLKIFLRQTSQVQKNYWIPKMNIWTILATFLKLSTGAGIDAPKYWHLVIGLALIAVLTIIFFLIKNKKPFKWFVFLLLFVPFLSSIIISLKRSIYLDRYFIFVLPFYFVLITGALIEIKNKKIRNIILSLVILGNLIFFPLYWQSLKVSEKPGMDAAANYLNQEVKQNEKIVFGSSFVYFNFKYYNQTGVYPVLYSPGTLSHFSGTALLSEKDIIKDFNKLGSGKTVWLINTTGFGNYQPEIPNNWLKIEEKGFEDIQGRGWITAGKYKIQ